MDQSFWSVVDPEFIPQPLDMERVGKFVEQHGIDLPVSYIKLLRSQNGGYIERNSFQSLAGRIINYIDRISGIGGHELDIVEESKYFIEEWGLPTGLVLLAGDGHWWIALDYRNLNSSGEPSVAYLESDSNIDYTIARDFQEFIDGLK